MIYGDELSEDDWLVVCIYLGNLFGVFFVDYVFDIVGLYIYLMNIGMYYLVIVCVVLIFSYFLCDLEM